MNDKNGHPLHVGDKVKVFTYQRGVVIGFEYRDEEVSLVRNKTGVMAVYSEEIVRQKLEHKKQ